MDEFTHISYFFDDFELDALHCTLSRAGLPVELRPRCFDVLVSLVSKAGELVTKDEIIEKAWPEVVVTEDSLTRCISDIRKALDDNDHRIIRTIPRRGYLFTSQVFRNDSGRILSDAGWSTIAVPDAPGKIKHQQKLPKSSPIRIMKIVATIAFLLVLGSVGVWYWQQSGHSPLTVKPMIAVLPFRNLSTERPQDYLGEGIAMDITTILGKSNDMLVIAPQSSFRFKDQRVNAGEIGQKLGVRYLVQGSIRRDPERLRVTAQLTDTKTNTQLWADSYDKKPELLFNVRDDMIHKIISALKAQVNRAELGRISGKKLESMDAYELTLRGRKVLERISSHQRGEVITEARDFFNRAILHDSTFAPAVEGLANTYLWAWLEPTPNHPLNAEYRQPETIERARQIAQQAIDLDPTFAEARATLGWILFWMYGPSQGISEFERALEFNPNFVDARFGLLLSHAGRAPDALRYMEKIMRLDPFHSPRYTYLLGKGYFFIGDYEEAIKLIRRAAQQMPDHRPSHVLLAAVAALLGRKDEAEAASIVVMRIHPEFTITNWMEFMRISSPNYRERLVNGLRMAALPE